MTLQSSAYMHLAFPCCYGVGNKARLIQRYNHTIAQRCVLPVSFPVGGGFTKVVTKYERP